MIIIVDGADGTGKTTLCNALVKEFDAKYLHATWSKELDARMLEYHMSILSDAYDAVVKENKIVVLDRLWVSEAIYAQVYRSGSRYPREAAVMDKFIEGIGGLNIVCTVSDLDQHAKEFEELSKTRFEMYANVQEVAIMYNVFWENTMAKGHVERLTDQGYLRDAILEGGVCNRNNYMQYDRFTSDRVLPAYTMKVREKLDALRF